jgi:hypothetical protein
MTCALLFTVVEAFQLSGRGCVLVPGIGPDSGISNVRVGDRIRLIKPDGESIDTAVHGVEMIHYTAMRPPEKIFVPILLPSTISKADVPPGTQVFYLGRCEAK